jgi:glycosyltransferase involved in cell wall biosynthesis
MSVPVSVIMPVRNEQRHLAAAVHAVLNQNYDGQIQVVLAVGPSQDATQAVAADLAASDARVTVVANPSGRTPDALNAAIAACRHDIIARVDAHSELAPGYLTAAVAALQATGAVNVGGVMAAVGQTPFTRAVAAAMRSPLGVGAASFHTGGTPGPADTVYLGVFQRSALVNVGGYDSHFSRAQDWELNYRLRAAGGLVWFDPSLVVTYRPRSSLPALARQYFDYGSWRREVMRRHRPTRAQLARYLAPPLAVAGSLLGLVAAVTGFTWGLVLPFTYVGFLTVATAALAPQSGRAAVWLPAVLATMHWSWGLGFLSSRPKH